MTPKRIVYTHHAKLRLQSRNISRTDVRWLLAKGVREPMEAPYWSRRGYIGQTEVRLIYIENATEIRVITVMWLGRDNQ